MKIGDLIDLSNNNKCPKCGKELKFLYENSHGDRQIATCCGNQYWILPSRFYVIEEIMEDTYMKYKKDK
jgi:rRNA maturation protein Nop10